MDLDSRQAAFLLDEMDETAKSEDRPPSEQREAARIRDAAEAALTE